MVTSRKKYLSWLLSLLILLPLVSACATKPKTAAIGPVTLTVYGLDPSDVIAPITTAYKTRRPTVTIKYVKFDDRADYENILVNQLAEGEGPDVMYIHNSWLPHHTKKLVPLSSTSLTPETYSTAFVNVAQDDFVQPDPKDGVKKIYAVPLFVDTLALYYNQDHYEKALPEQGKPGSTWEAVKKESVLLKQLDESSGALTRGSIALGNAQNVSLSVDILMNMILQSGVSFYDKDYKQAQFAQDGQTAFETFLGFANRRAKEFGWSSDLVDATAISAPELDAFLKGKVSSIVAYANLYPTLAAQLKAAKNGGKNTIALSDIKVAPLPQLSTDDTKYRTLASYYGLAVSRNSKNQALAWDFAQFATSNPVSKAYVAKTKLPSARRDLLEEQKKDPVLSVFVSQIGTATTVKELSEARYHQIFEDAINKANLGTTPRTALSEAQAKINDIMKRESPKGLYPPVVIPKKK